MFAVAASKVDFVITLKTANMQRAARSAALG
jgi:hypothetical protein